MMSRRTEYATKMKLQIDELNTAMSEVEAKMHEARQDVCDKYSAEIGKLHRQSDLAMAKLEEVRAASEESWEGLVTDSEKARNAFVHSVHYCQSQLQGAPQRAAT